MIYDPDLRGVMRYTVMDYMPVPGVYMDPKTIAGPFSDDECAAFIRTYRKAVGPCCWFVWTYDMNGYQDEALWGFVPFEDEDAMAWMARMRYSLEAPEDYQLPMFEPLQGKQGE